MLARRPLWFDEIFTVWASRLPLRALRSLLANDSGPPLWYVLERPFVAAGERLFSSDVIARVPSFLAAIAVIAAAPSLPTRPARLRFALLASASPLLCLYSTEARSYALLSLVCLATFVLASRGEETPGRLAALVFLSAVALFTHYLAIFAIGSLVLVAAAEKRLRSSLALVAGAVPFLSWVPVMAAQPPQAVAWMHEPPAEFVTGILSSLGGAGNIPHPFGRQLPALLMIAGGALALVALLSLARLWREDVAVRRALAFLVLFFGGVVFASLVRPVAFAGRTEMAILPVWLWIVALAGDRTRTVRIVSLAMVFVAAVSSAILLAEPRGPLPVARALEHIEAAARPGDALVAGAHFYLPARLAADRGRLTIPVEAFPPDQASHPGWALPRWPRLEDLAGVDRVIEAAGATGRVFLLVPPSYRLALAPVIGRRGVTRRLVETEEMLLAVWSAR